MDLPNVAWFGSDTAHREEELANDQQQACCEPTWLPAKRKQLSPLSPGAAMCSAHGALVTFCELHTSRISTA